MVEIEIHKSIKGRLTAGVIEFVNLNCQEYNDELWNKIEYLSEELKSQYASPSHALEQLKPARDLYRAVGIEPTRIRPSSEALLRRVIKNKKLYRINSIVDVSNYCSLSFLLPIGLYDTKKINGKVLFRLGRKGEEFEGIRKDMVHVSGRLTLTDEKGPFGNPSSDSLRTSINLKTTDVLMVIFAPFSYSRKKLEKYCEFAVITMNDFHSKSSAIHSEIIS